MTLAGRQHGCHGWVEQPRPACVHTAWRAQKTGEITYNGAHFREFIPQRTSAYITQFDEHMAELTVRETLDFSRRVQGAGSRTCAPFSAALTSPPVATTAAASACPQVAELAAYRTLQASLESACPLQHLPESCCCCRCALCHSMLRMCSGAGALEAG